MNNAEIEKELKTLNDKFDFIKELITDNGIRTIHKQNKDLLVSSNCNVSGTIEELNSFTKRNNPSDSVFLFDITLCNSKPDRDNECFSVKSLYDMRSLFLGKTGYIASNSTQMARIFKTWIVQTKEFYNGFPVCELKASAYMIRTSENENVIKEIETGIRKEVSISCSVMSRVKVNKTTLLDGVQDVYEWSFVEPPMLADNKLKYFYDDSEKESNWFSIEDKSPNRGTFVLAVCDIVDANAPKGRKLTLKAVYKTKENDYVDERNCLQRVIKWMPLPDGTPPLWQGTFVCTGEKIL